MKLEERFKALHHGDYMRFDRVNHKLSQRADLHAFLLLDKLQPGHDNIVACSVHDEISLSIDVEDLNEVITDEQVLDLIRCGVRYGEYDHLMMYV